LYKTADSGQTWEPIKLDLPEEAKVAHVFFVNPSTGWVVLQKSKPDIWEHYEEFQNWVMRTTDGGQTWQLQHEDRNSDVTRILFVTDQEGWLTGVRYLGSPLRSFHLLFHTLDQGQHWMDASGELNHTAAQVWRRHAREGTGDLPGIGQVYSDLVDDFITDIRSERALNATVLTLDGNVYKTDDGGQYWQIVEEHGPDYLSFSVHNRLGINADKQFWVALSADSSRGMFGRLKMAEGNSWKQYTLPDVYFWDASLLPEGRLLVCGYEPSSASRPTELTHGVVLYSGDRGNTWVTVYSSPAIEAVRSFAIVSPTSIWAVGDKGLILHLTPSENRHLNLAAHIRRKIRR
jgi:photosystem II stability/assembly factor-like uncharacterized protein